MRDWRRTTRRGTLPSAGAARPCRMSHTSNLPPSAHASTGTKKASSKKKTKVRKIFHGASTVIDAALELARSCCGREQSVRQVDSHPGSPDELHKYAVGQWDQKVKSLHGWTPLCVKFLPLITNMTECASTRQVS